MWTAPNFPVNQANCPEIEKPHTFDRAPPEETVVLESLRSRIIWNPFDPTIQGGEYSVWACGFLSAHTFEHVGMSDGRHLLSHVGRASGFPLMVLGAEILSAQIATLQPDSGRLVHTSTAFMTVSSSSLFHRRWLDFEGPHFGSGRPGRQAPLAREGGKLSHRILAHHTDGAIPAPDRDVRGVSVPDQRPGSPSDPRICCSSGRTRPEPRSSPQKRIIRSEILSLSAFNGCRPRSLRHRDCATSTVCVYSELNPQCIQRLTILPAERSEDRADWSPV
jgi:hypothetical protein